jgi:amino acid adenylation domain-containing protein
MHDLEARIAGLSPEKRAVLQRLLRQKGVDVAPLGIRPRPRTSTNLPLTFAQRGLWFLDRLAPGSSFYNVVDSVVLDEPVDQAVLARCLNDIIGRHEALRTTFALRQGEPVQIVAPSLELTLDVKDYRALPAHERDTAVARWSTEFADWPFDLSQGPLLRASLIRSNPDACELLLSMHHIVSDAWSLDVLERELRALYAAFVQGRASLLEPLPIQYADFAFWQRDRLKGDVLASLVAYWTRTLAGAPQVLDLPMARVRPPMPSYRGAAQTRLVPTAVAQSLRALAQGEGATLFMLTLAAFNVLLSRYTERDDILVGTPVAGRHHAETEPLIGFFVNTIVIRSDLSDDPAFRTLLRRTRDACLGAFAHQELPFEMLVESLQPDRDPSRNPLFQVTFQCTSVPDRDDDGVSIGEPDDARVASETEVSYGTAKFDLMINVWDSGSSLRVQADYSTDLFDDAAVTRLLEHFEHVLRSVADEPDGVVSSIALLGDDERRRVLDEWNRTTTSYPRDASLGELFDRQVRAAPSAIAVQCGTEALSYAALQARADALARTLEQRGVGPECPVGLLAERSIEMIVGLLGIAKAGGAYVPLDPEYPPRRLAFMVDDARVRVLVTDGRLGNALHDVACTVVDIEAAEREAGYGAAAPGTAARPDSPAYVIYTSGSTGTPKGVVVTHRAVARTVCATNYLQIARGQRMAQLSNTAFDAATMEIWGALLNGATLVILPRDLLLDPDRLGEQLRRERVDVVFVTTAVLNLVAARAPHVLADVPCVLFGGEAADSSAVRTICDRGAPGRLLNLYGPTESTTFTTWHAVEGLPDRAAPLPIGRPVSNTQVYLLDRRLQPVPVGVIGELYIGGDGLARGYMHDSRRTAECFVPSPFGPVGSRLYRTGDLARYRPDGAVEFVGRRDGQVKIRGHRIELAEVEALIGEHPDVRDVVARCREDAHRHKQLVAYVVPRDARGFDAAALTAHVAQRAPGFMVPAFFVPLAELPLTPNGKVDRAALPSPEQVRQRPTGEDVSLRTSTEERIAVIFAAALNAGPVSADANFFELGGHSLLATHVVSRVSETFKVDVPLRAIFTDPTVAGLAKIVDDLVQVGGAVPDPPITAVARHAYRVTRSPNGELQIPETMKPLLHVSSR